MRTKNKGTPASGLKCLKCCGISAATSGLQVPFCLKYCLLNTPTAQPAQQSTFRTFTLHGAIFPPSIAEAKSYSSACTHSLTFRDSHRPWPYRLQTPSVPAVGKKQERECGRSGIRIRSLQKLWVFISNQAEKKPKGTLQVEFPIVGTAFLFSRLGESSFYSPTARKKNRQGDKCCRISAATY